jgi:hypothetical protein
MEQHKTTANKARASFFLFTLWYRVFTKKMEGERKFRPKAVIHRATLAALQCFTQ